MERTQPLETEANFSIEEYGAKTAEKEECEEQLLAEYATLLGFYLASAAVLTGIAVQQNRLPRKFGLLDLALLGMATHKLSRIVAKERITGILRAPFVSYIRGSRPSGDAVLRRDFGTRSRLGFPPPRVPQDEGRKIENILTRRFASASRSGSRLGGALRGLR